MRTYDVQITNIRTNDRVSGGRRQGLSHLAPPLKGFGDPDITQQQYVFSGTDSVAMSSSWCATNTVELFRVGRAR